LSTWQKATSATKKWQPTTTAANNKQENREMAKHKSAAWEIDRKNDDENGKPMLGCAFGERAEFVCTLFF